MVLTACASVIPSKGYAGEPAADRDEMIPGPVKVGGRHDGGANAILQFHRGGGRIPAWLGFIVGVSTLKMSKSISDVILQCREQRFAIDFVFSKLLSTEHPRLHL